MPLSREMHWGPHDAFGLTAREFIWWLEQFNRIIDNINKRVRQDRARRR